MTAANETLADQKARWHGPAGRAWVTEQALLDRLYQPIPDLLVEAIAARRPEALLDVGCGTGAITLAARARAEAERLPATFLRADAQAHLFETASAGMIVSRLRRRCCPAFGRDHARA